MARRNGGVGKTIALLLLIIILVLGGMFWFSYLGVMKPSKIFSPVYKVLHLDPQTSRSATRSKPLTADLEEDRFAKRLEALNIREETLDKREEDVAKSEGQNEAIAKELEERKKSQDEREKTFNNQVKKYDDRNVNIEQIVSYLNSQPPKTVVDQLVAMDDQDVIDILRKADEMAEKNRTTSMSSVWLMYFPAERAAEVQRKMANKPVSLD